MPTLLSSTRAAVACSSSGTWGFLSRVTSTGQASVKKSTKKIGVPQGCNGCCHWSQVTAALFRMANAKFCVWLLSQWSASKICYPQFRRQKLPPRSMQGAVVAISRSDTLWQVCIPSHDTSVCDATVCSFSLPRQVHLPCKSLDTQGTGNLCGLSVTLPIE